MPTRTTARRGFTLIELLVVIAIIAVLAGLLLPALSNAKFQARNAHCRNNLRQISIAAQAYASTHETYPSHDWRFAGSPPRPWWVALDLPVRHASVTSVGRQEHLFSRIEGVYRCPLNQGIFETMEYGTGSGQPLGSKANLLIPAANDYGLNVWGVGSPSEPFGLGGHYPEQIGLRYVPTKDAAIRAPSDLIAFGDCFVRSRNSAYDGLMDSRGEIRPETYLVSYTRLGQVKPFKQQPSFLSHRARANRAFADGHLEIEDMRKTFAATDAELRRWNVDNLPHRDRLQD